MKAKSNVIDASKRFKRARYDRMVKDFAKPTPFGIISSVKFGNFDPIKCTGTVSFTHGPGDEPIGFVKNIRPDPDGEGFAYDVEPLGDD